MSRTTAHIPKGTHMLPRAKYNTVGFHFALVDRFKNGGSMNHGVG